MTYFMIILIWSTTMPSRKEAITYPVHNYEHCMELKDAVREAIEQQSGFRAAVVCPPLS
jgi:hypothetical protein